MILKIAVLAMAAVYIGVRIWSEVLIVKAQRRGDAERVQQLRELSLKFRLGALLALVAVLVATLLR